MSGAETKPHLWSDKRVASKPIIYAVGLLLGLGFLVLRLKPYFSAEEIIRPFVRETVKKNSDQGPSAARASEGVSASDRIGKIPQGYSIKSRSTGSSRNESRHVIARPFFFGRYVLLNAILNSSLSNKSGDSTAEVEIENGIDLLTQDSEDELQGARLIGTITADMETKRFQLRFNQVVTKNGSRHPTVAFAYDPKSNTTGVLAKYTSNAPLRILGALTSDAVNLGIDAVESKVISQSGDDPLNQKISQTISLNARNGGHDLADELSRGLKQQQPTLELQSGTSLVIKARFVESTKGISE